MYESEQKQAAKKKKTRKKKIKPPAARIVLTTAATVDEARRLGRVLVEEKLAACATVIPQVESIYHWHGQVEMSGEAMLLLKTETDKLGELQARLMALHTYDTPEFLVLPVEAGSAEYLDWLHRSISGS